MSAPLAPGEVIGRPGAQSMTGTEAFEGASKIGSVAEAKTAGVIDTLARKLGGPTVFHDLQIPGSPANIDHAIVSGSKVYLIDSKNWKPGFYWTLAGKTYRGFTPVPHADKKTLPMAVDRLRARGIEVAECFLVAWPSSAGKLSMTFYRPAGAKALPGSRLLQTFSRRAFSKPADPIVVSSILPLVRK